MYNPKFNYTPLDRVTIEGQRKYTSPQGDRLPSVTTILEATKPEEKKQALHEWRKRVGVERAQQITTEAANRGTKMHTYLEHYIRDGVLKEKPGNPFHHPSWHMAKTIIEHGLINVHEIWGLEVPLFYKDIYAGTTDACGIHLGSECIIDYKQTNKPKKREWIEDYFLQLAAYSEAHNSMFGTSIKKGIILMSVKPLIDPNTMQLLESPEYQEFVLENDEFETYRVKWWQRVEQFYTKL